LGEGHPDFTQSLNNLAALLDSTGRYDEAEPLFRQALEVRRAALGEGHPDFATSLNNLAFLLQATGRYDEAEPLFRRALEVRRAALGEDHPDFAQSLNNLAFLLQATGRYDEVEPLYRRALEVRRAALGEGHPDFAQSLNNLAAFCVATGRAREAADLMQRSFGIEDRLIARVFPLLTDVQRLAFLRQIRTTLEVFLSLVTRHLAHDPSAVRAAFEAVLRRKALTAEAQIALRKAVASGRYPHLREPLGRWHGLLQQIARRTLEGPRPTEDAAEHQQALAALQTQCDRLETELAAQVPEMRLEQQLQAADRRAVALHLPEGVSLVEFVRFDDYDFHAVPARGERHWKPARYLAFILPAGRPDDVRMIDLGEAAPIDALIEDFRQAIEHGDDGRRAAKLTAHVTIPAPRPAAEPPTAGPGIALRKLVFDPLLPYLAGRGRLLVSPDGGLARLPLEILPADAPNRCLIDDYRIHYLAAGRDLLRLAEPATTSPHAALIVGDPDFDLALTQVTETPATEQTPPAGKRSVDLTRSGLPFGPLDGTGAEATAVAGLLGVEPILKGHALESSVKGAQSPPILHLATHGFFLSDQEYHHTHGGCEAGPRGEDPLLRSGLALAGANWRQKKFLPPAAAEDGMLTAQDVTGMDLTGTELVVLSACDTGLGAVHNGEGVFGLRRAFVLAGARTLVMSLWKVPDEQTQELMIDYYQRLLKGEPRAEALRQAQLSMKAKRPEPLYWGAFICQGDPGPLARFA
jgi:CHAT domain-containing protein/tetratricopeptide (TPR) repeat protein